MSTRNVQIGYNNVFSLAILQLFVFNLILIHWIPSNLSVSCLLRNAIKCWNSSLFLEVCWQAPPLNIHTGWPVKHGRVKMLLVQCMPLYTCTLEKSLFPGYKKNTTIFIWSPCTKIKFGHAALSSEYRITHQTKSLRCCRHATK